MSYDNTGRLVMYLTDGRFAGRILSYDPENKTYILDRKISDGSRNAFVRVENEGKMWRFCDERLPEYARQNGYACLVIHPGYGGFSIYDKNGELYENTERHNPLLVQQAIQLIKPERGHRNEYKLVLIPSFMTGHYCINEYDGAESVKLLVDKYKTDEIAKIRKGFKNPTAQFEEIDRILEMDIKIL
jgi:hypothetical protein